VVAAHVIVTVMVCAQVSAKESVILQSRVTTSSSIKSTHCQLYTDFPAEQTPIGMPLQSIGPQVAANKLKLVLAFAGGRQPFESHPPSGSDTISTHVVDEGQPQAPDISKSGRLCAPCISVAGL
jgi:hypothetical protein